MDLSALRGARTISVGQKSGGVPVSDRDDARLHVLDHLNEGVVC